MRKYVVKEYAQSWRPDMKGKVDTQARQDPGGSFGMDGGDQFYPRGLRENATVFRDSNWRRGRSVCMRTLCGKRKKGN